MDRIGGPDCLDEARLAALLDSRAVDESALARLDAHLADCGRCRALVGEAYHGAMPSALRAPATAVRSNASGSAEAAVRRWLGLGDVLADKYRLTEVLGRGGMGQVFAALHVELGHRVAIKVLHSEDPSAAARFLREAQAGARLTTDHAVRVFDLGRLPGGAPFIVMECLIGEDLAQLVGRGPIPPSDAARYAIEACAALTEAHAAGIVHRDLKPANLFLAARSGAPPLLKVLDFGISKLAGDDPPSALALTSTGTILGSPLYMSPEQIRGHKEIDLRTDIWSLGVVLYELLTGRRPFRGDTLAAVAASIVSDIVRPPSSVRPDLPAAFDDVVLRCLEKDPALRFASSAELARALAPFASRAQTAGAAPASSRCISHRQNLPAQTTLFVGRERELREVEALLDDRRIRLVTLVAPGGMGKSRFAVEAGARLSRSERPLFADGVFFVQLAPVGSVDSIVSTIAESIGFRFDSSREPLGQLVDFLRERRLLLLVDNFEHLLGGAPIVSEILLGAPGVKVLATSRERLGLRVETLYTLSGLEVPEGGIPTDARDFSAVHLFVQSASQVRPDLQLGPADFGEIVRICRLVDGMPLGLVLAASWVGVLPVKDIAEEIQRSADFLETELRDVPPRQRSIRAVFDQSWNLLSEEERSVFSKLSIFRGGFTRDAALAVAAARLPILAALLHKSLLSRSLDGGRYHVHELLRQYAEERLRAHPSMHEPTLDAHADYFAGFLAKREDQLKGVRPKAALDDIGREIDNVRAAWTRMIEVERLANLSDSMQSLALFFRDRAWSTDPRSRSQASFREARLILSSVVEKLDGATAEMTDERARIFGLALSLRVDFSDQPRAGSDGDLLGKALSILGGTPHRREQARVTLAAGRAEAWSGRLREGLALAERAVALWRALGDPFELAAALYQLGFLYFYGVTDHERAEKAYRESVDIQRALDVRREGLVDLGGLLCRRGQHAEGYGFLSEGLTRAEDLDLLGQQLHCHMEMSIARRAVGDLTTAASHAQNALRISLELGNRYEEMWSHSTLGDVLAADDRYDEAEEHYRALQRRAEETQDLFAGAIANVNLGELALFRERYEDADRWSSAGLSFFEGHGSAAASAWALDRHGYVAAVQGQHAVAARELLRAFDSAVECAILTTATSAVAGLALILARTGEPLLAVELLGFAHRHPATEYPTRRRRVDPLVTELRRLLAADEFAAGFARGSELTMEVVRAKMQRLAG
jgi:predicted ATPase